MADPARFIAGFTQDRDFQPLSLLGVPNPFFYATYDDDFNYYNAGDYTVTTTGNGSIVQTAGDGGQVTFTTNSSIPAAADVASLQLKAAMLTLSTTKKWAYFARVQLADPTNPALNAGLIQTTTTPFTVTDGVYFGKASGATYPTVSVVSGSAVQASVSLSGIAAFAANTYLDLGFVYDGKSDLLVFAGSGLVGQVDQDAATLGPVARITGVGLLTLSAAVLNPTLALESGTATSKTMVADFQFSAKER